VSNCIGEDYEKLDRMVISIYQDYNLLEFPIDIFKLCKRMGLKLFKYSSFEGNNLKLLKKKSNDGFYCPTPDGPAIFYNDKGHTEERIRMTIGHEIKHFVCNDVTEDDKEERMADHFARFLLCPTPFLVYFEISSVFEIMDTFQLSYSAATSAQNALKGRCNYYKNKIFDYEQPLIKLFI